MLGLTKTFKIRPTLVHTPDLNMDPLYRHSVAPFVRMYILKENYRCDQTKLGARVIDIGYSRDPLTKFTDCSAGTCSTEIPSRHSTFDVQQHP